MFFFCLLVALEDEVDGRRVREFRGAAETAVLDVEKLGDGFDLRFNDAEVEFGAGAGEDFGLRDGVGEGVGGALECGAFVAVRIGDGEKNAAESGAAHLVFRREIGAAERGLADRKSTRLNSSHTVISYAVFCLKKKNQSRQ